ncbi:MAG: hypothetical protein ACOCYA_06860, partial [Spirochaetota bacterium]
MEEDRILAKGLFRKTIAAVVGLDPNTHVSLGGKSIETEASPESPLYGAVIDIFKICAAGKALPGTDTAAAGSLGRLLREGASDAKGIFVSFYSRKENAVRARTALAVLENLSRPQEEKASVVAGIWAPEIEMAEEDIVRRWRLSDVEPNPEPIGPTEVVIQLNALYTLPEDGGAGAGTTKEDRARSLLDDPGRKIADYDHPVHLYERDEN